MTKAPVADKNVKTTTKKITIKSIHDNIYFLKKSKGQLPSAKFFGMHPKSKRLFMFFGKAENSVLFAVERNTNELLRCKKESTICEDHDYCTIKFLSRGGKIVVRVPIGDSNIYACLDDEDIPPVILSQRNFEF